jgi:hypothetical protein
MNSSALLAAKVTENLSGEKVPKLTFGS